MDCFLDELPLCVEGERLQTNLNNAIKLQFKTLFNQTETLGKELMDECSFVQSKQSQLMTVLAGSDKCSFYEYETRRLAMQECRAAVKKTRNGRLDLLGIAPDAQ